MNHLKSLFIMFALSAAFSCSGTAAGAEKDNSGVLSVAVTGRNIEAIVLAIGGDQVETFSLFKGCILRSDLDVIPDIAKRLAGADVVVWTGFLKESAAIHASLNEKQTERPKSEEPVWIDISNGTKRVNVPTSTCYGYLETEFAPGDPFFWLNPKNGPVIAWNIAEGLGTLRPDKHRYFLANATAFTKSLNSDIKRWEEQLAELEGLRIFATLCGWQNFTQMGGPQFVVYKATPGSLPETGHLMEQLKRMEVEVVLLDPSTSSDDRKAFLQETSFKVLEMPSCIETIPGARTYNALFDNFIQVLLKNSAKRAPDL